MITRQTLNLIHGAVDFNCGKVLCQQFFVELSTSNHRVDKDDPAKATITHQRYVASRPIDNRSNVNLDLHLIELQNIQEAV